jgi:hypothetical protein
MRLPDAESSGDSEFEDGIHVNRNTRAHSKTDLDVGTRGYAQQVRANGRRAGDAPGGPDHQNFSAWPDNRQVAAGSDLL